MVADRGEAAQTDPRGRQAGEPVFDGLEPSGPLAGEWVKEGPPGCWEQVRGRWTGVPGGTPADQGAPRGQGELKRATAGRFGGPEVPGC